MRYSLISNSQFYCGEEATLLKSMLGSAESSLNGACCKNARHSAIARNILEATGMLGRRLPIGVSETIFHILLDSQILGKG